MDDKRPTLGGPDEEELTDGEHTPDSSVMTEGVGGMPDLEPEERATVSDVDGDNVKE